MNKDQIITLDDLLNFEKRIIEKLNHLRPSLEKNEDNSKPNYLRSKGARELLKVSENKLRSMRDNGEIPFSFIGSTYFYPEKKILKLLEENTINNKL